jgi:hypothetical protein
VTSSIRAIPQTDGCGDLPAPAKVPDPAPIVRPPFVLPMPSDPAWQDPDTVRRIAHPSIHTRPQAGCDLCPPVDCPCGINGCPDVFDHARTWAAAEATLLERCA